MTKSIKPLLVIVAVINIVAAFSFCIFKSNVKADYISAYPKNAVEVHHKVEGNNEADATKIPILTFHTVVNDNLKKSKYSDNEWYAALSDFEKQMKYLYDNGYKTISAEEFENWYDGKVEYPKKTVMLTFDDGDYDFYYLVYPVLKKYHFKAVSFIIGSYTKDFTKNTHADKRYRIGKDVIKKLSYEYPGIEFQSHTYNLHYRTSDDRAIVEVKSYDEIMDDFESNKRFNFKYLAYPYGTRTPEFIKATEDSGINMAFKFGYSVPASRTDARFEISRIKINGQIQYDEYVKILRSCLE